jgi:twitching motility protein PilT
MNGELLPHGDPLPRGEEFEALLFELLELARIRDPESLGDTDFTFSAVQGRFRAQIFHSQEGQNAVIRRIPLEPESVTALGIPDYAVQAADHATGLVLVCGPSGCGKTTTIAALLDRVNGRDQRYAITVERPVEYVFQPRQCVIHQMTVGGDMLTFAAGLRTAISSRADVIVVGDVDDAETVRLMLRAAEAGTLVLASMNANGAVEAIDRMLDLLPQEDHAIYRNVLAQSLRSVLYQVLLAGRTGGRVPAFEVLTNTRAVQGVLRENKTHELLSVIQSGKQQGMRSLDDTLEELVAGRLIQRDEALPHVRNRQRFETRA